jgi:hypothetical protein
MVCLLTPQEVGKQLNVSPITVIRLVDSGAPATVAVATRQHERILRFAPEAVAHFRTRRKQIPCVRVGKYLRFNLGDIDARARNGGAEVRRGGGS